MLTSDHAPLDSELYIAAIIATCDRAHLLAERSLPSVLTQTKSPDLIIIVDDSSPETYVKNAELITNLKPSSSEVIYLRNQRTRGASGAWNTAVDHLTGHLPDHLPNLHHVFLAILDDDDAWPPEYLERCAEAAQSRELDMVAAGIRRIESPATLLASTTSSKSPQLSDAPLQLCVKDFLTTNPGIQGSNLFLRLPIMLAAGGFDEGLRSSTDRDLCIRIAELGRVRYGQLLNVWVDHYADSGRSRLSERASPAKLEGLTSFWRKYHGRMNADQMSAFRARAAELFGWSQPQAAQPRRLQDPQDLLALDESRWACDEAPPRSPIRLHVGVITSEPSTLEPLLDGLSSLHGHAGIEALSVLVLDNASPEGELEVAAQSAREMGLEIAVISEERQRADAEEGSFGSGLRDRPRGQVGIARARTMLQRYLGATLTADEGSFGWVLDDDMRVDERAGAYLSWLPMFRERGVDALIGAYEGSSPNPPLNGLRVHLVDLLHNLHWLRSLPEDALLPDRTDENDAQRALYPDYYYDLSRKHTAHLETPHWLEPAVPDETVKEAYARLLSSSVGILSGDPLTRPIIAASPRDPLASARDSVNRGGHTLILNPRALTDTPNLITSVHGREARRSDMVWAIVNRYYRRLTIKAVSFPIHHIGRVGTPLSLDDDEVRDEKAQSEIMGSTLYAGLTEFLRAQPQHELGFSHEEIEEVCDLADRHLERRWRALKQSFHRVMGLREALRRAARPGELSALLSYLDAWFTLERFVKLRADLKAHDRDEVVAFLKALRSSADDYARSAISSKISPKISVMHSDTSTHTTAHTPLHTHHCTHTTAHTSPNQSAHPEDP